MAFCTKSAHAVLSPVIVLSFRWLCGSRSSIFVLQVQPDAQSGTELFRCRRSIWSSQPRSPPWLWGQRGASKNRSTQSVWEVSIISLHWLPRKPEVTGFIWMSPPLSYTCAPRAAGNMSKDHLADSVGLVWPSNHHLKALGSSATERHLIWISTTKKATLEQKTHRKLPSLELQRINT